jgi:hypothetical protein
MSKTQRKRQVNPLAQIAREEFKLACGNDPNVAKTVRRMLRLFVDPLVFGKRPTPDGNAKYVNLKDDLNQFLFDPKTFFDKVHSLPQWTILRSVANGRTFPLTLRWYTSRIVHHQGRRIVLLQLDVDFHKAGLSDADSLYRAVEQRLGPEVVYPEPSTNGKGVHAYLIVSFETNFDATRIRAWSLELGRVLYGIHKGRFASELSEVRGYPSIRKSKKYVTLGRLAKIPTLPTPADAARFANLMVIDRLSLEEAFGWSFDSSEDRSSLNTYPNYYGNTIVGTFESSVSSESREVVELQGDDAQRMFRLVAFLCRRWQRVPTVEEALGEYQKRLLNTGDDRDGNRRRNAEDAIRLVGKDFRAACQPLKYLHLVEGHIADSQIKAAYAVKDRLLTKADVAVFYWLIRDALPLNGEGDFARNYFLKVSRLLKKKGLCERVLDHKKIASCKRLLLGAGLIKQTRQGRKGRGADRFRLGPVQ